MYCARNPRFACTCFLLNELVMLVCLFKDQFCPFFAICYYAHRAACLSVNAELKQVERKASVLNVSSSARCCSDLWAYLLPDSIAALWEAMILPSGIPGPWGQWESLEQGRHTISGEGTNPGTFKYSGHTHVRGSWWDVPRSAEGAHQYHCEATLDYLWRVTVIREGFKEESKCHSYLQEGQAAACRELQASQLLSMLGKVIQQIILESIFKHMKDKKVIWNSQEESCLTNLKQQQWND